MTSTWQSQVYGNTKSGYRMVTSTSSEQVQEALKGRNPKGQGLSERDREILELRFGVEGPPATLQAIGDQYGITRERVRQIIERALDRLSLDPWSE